MDARRTLISLLAAQHGVVLRSQARACGLDHRAVKRLVDRGELIADGTRLLRAGGAPLTRHTRLVAAMLEVGDDSALAFDTGSAFWGVPGFAFEPIAVLRPVGRRVRTHRYAVEHTSRTLPPHHVIERCGLRITTPTRTLFDLAMTCSPTKLERALDTAWAMRLTDGPRLVRMLDEMRRSGRSGITAIEALIDARGPDWVPPESGIERRFHSLLRDDGQRPMRIQVEVGDDELIGRVDAVDDEAAVVVEIQSDRFHRSPSDVASDAVRRRRLEAQGFAVVEVWEHEVFHAPGPMLQELRELRRLRRRSDRAA